MGNAAVPGSRQGRDHRGDERIRGGEVHGPGVPRGVLASPQAPGGITALAAVDRLERDTEPDSRGHLKAKRPPGEAWRPRGPDRGGRTANGIRACAPTRLMGSPPAPSPGDCRGAGSLLQ